MGRFLRNHLHIRVGIYAQTSGMTRKQQQDLRGPRFLRNQLLPPKPPSPQRGCIHTYHITWAQQDIGSFMNHEKMCAATEWEGRRLMTPAHSRRSLYFRPAFQAGRAQRPQLLMPAHS